MQHIVALITLLLFLNTNLLCSASLWFSLKSPLCLEADRQKEKHSIIPNHDNHQRDRERANKTGAGSVRQTESWSGSYWFYWGRALRMALTSSATAVRANSNWSWKEEETFKNKNKNITWIKRFNGLYVK